MSGERKKLFLVFAAFLCPVTKSEPDLAIDISVLRYKSNRFSGVTGTYPVHTFFKKKRKKLRAVTKKHMNLAINVSEQTLEAKLKNEN